MSPETRGSRGRWSHLARPMLGVSLIALLLWSAGPDSLLESFGSISFGWLALALGAHFLAKLVRALRWQEILRVSGIRKGLGDLLATLYVGFFFNNFLPSSMGGDVVRGYYSSDGKDTLPTAYGVIVAERLTGLVALNCMCVIVTAVLLATGSSIPAMLLWSCLAMSAAITCAGSAVFLFRGWSSILERWMSRHERLAGAASKVFAAVHFLRQPGCRVGLVASLTVLLQLVAVLYYFTSARAAGVGIPFKEFFFVVPIAVVASMVPLSPNGIGLREGAFVGLLKLLGVAATTATAFALLARLIDLVFGLIGGAIFLLGATRRTGHVAPSRKLGASVES